MILVRSRVRLGAGPHERLFMKTRSKRQLATSVTAVLVSLVLVGCGGGGGAPAGTHALSVMVTSEVGAGESFVFARTGGEQVTVTQRNVPIAFATGLATGTSYTIAQLSGPRACQISPNPGIVGNVDVVVSASCGSPPGPGGGPPSPDGGPPSIDGGAPSVDGGAAEH